MCKRSTPDPFVREALDRYGLNLLPQPLECLDCCQGFRRDATGRVTSAFTLDQVLTSPIDPVVVRRRERLGSLEGVRTESRDLSLGLTFLESFLMALGVSGVLPSIKAEYQRLATKGLAFEFRAIERDSVDAGVLGTALMGRRLNEQHPLVMKGSRYFVASAVVRSAELTVHAGSDARGGGGFDVSALEVASAGTKLSVQRESDTTLTYKGDRALAFGMELYELWWERDSDVLRLKTPDGPLNRRGAVPPAPERVLVGQDGSALLVLDAEPADELDSPTLSASRPNR